MSRELESGEEVEFTVTLELYAGRRATRLEPAEEPTAELVSVKDSEGREIELTEDEEEEVTSAEFVWQALERESEREDAGYELARAIREER